jgi:hypothetical protein
MRLEATPHFCMLRPAPARTNYELVSGDQGLECYPVVKWSLPISVGNYIDVWAAPAPRGNPFGQPGDFSP